MLEKQAKKRSLVGCWCREDGVRGRADGLVAHESAREEGTGVNNFGLRAATDLVTTHVWWRRRRKVWESSDTAVRTLSKFTNLEDSMGQFEHAESHLVPRKSVHPFYLQLH
jgi:hypothetical protein